MRKLLFLSFLFCALLTKATISQIRWGSTAGPLDGLTIDWTSTGKADQFRWGYTPNYEKGTYSTEKRNFIAIGKYFFKYAFPVVRADTKIYYQIYDSSTNTWSPQRTYATAPPEDTNKFSFIAQGDSRSNVATVWKNIADKVALRKNAFSLFTGDITNYGLSASQYDDWFSNAENYVGNNIIYHSQGNHDVPSSSLYYQNIFSLPSNNPEQTELYYSFKYGNALFISLNSEDIMSPISKQSVWLKSTLEASKNDSDITWRIVFFHKPLINAGAHYGEANSRRKNWGYWFDENDVDLVLNGHDHNYQRAKPVNFDSEGNVSIAIEYGVKPGQGICQMICGGSGAGLYRKGSNPDVDLTSIFYQGFNYVEFNIDDKVLTAKVYVLGSGTDSNAEERLLETVVIDKSEVLGTSDYKNHSQNPIHVSPNPAQESVNFKYSSEDRGEISVFVYDMSAKLVKAIKFNKNSTELSNSIDVADLTSGIYTLAVHSANGHRDSTIFIKK